MRRTVFTYDCIADSWRFGFVLTRHPLTGEGLRRKQAQSIPTKLIKKTGNNHQNKNRLICKKSHCAVCPCPTSIHWCCKMTRASCKSTQRNIKKHWESITLLTNRQHQKPRLLNPPLSQPTILFQGPSLGGINTKEQSRLLVT